MEWLPLLYIREGSASKLGPETGYPGSLSYLPPFIRGKCSDSKVKQGHGGFLSRRSQLIIQNRYIVTVEETS
jgi:hypothetical protein